MPKLPDFTDLGGVAPSAPRAFVAIPGADFSGARAMAEGLGQVSASIENIQNDREDKARKQERFDTKMGMLQAEAQYADRVKDLDPLDPDYVEKKKAVRRETFSPILSSVKDPENRQLFDLTTEEDYVNLGINAAKEHKVARGKKQAIDIGIYADDVMRKKASGQYDGDAAADIEQMIRDSTDLDEISVQELTQKYRHEADAVSVDTAFTDISRDGYTLRPDVKSAISAVEATSGAPQWMGPYLRQLAAVESSGGYRLSNSTTSAGGIYAFTDGTGKQYGMSSPEDKNDPAKATAGAVALTMDNFKVLKAALGRDPTPGELYLAHQQGADGASKLLANPDARAASVVGLSAVENNLPKKLQGKAGFMTAGEYASFWSSKFDGKSATAPTDPEETLSVIENMPEFQRLSAPEQIKFKAGMLSKIETDNAESEKLQKLADARTAVDSLVAAYPKPEDRDKAEKELRNTISDPDYLERAIGMLDTEYNRLDQNQKADADALFTKTADAVGAAVSAGKLDEAAAAIPVDMDPADRAKLNTFIRNKGGPRTDNQWRVDELTVMAGENPEAFAQVPLTKYINDLSGETYRRFQAEQEKIKTGKKETTTSFDSSKSMLGDMFQEIGVTNDTKAKPADVAIYNRIYTLARKNYEGAEAAKGSRLTSAEATDVFEKTFMQFRGLQTKGWDNPNAVLSLKDVTQNYAAKEEELGKLPGQLMNEAYADIQNSLAARIQDIENQIRSARDDYEVNRLRAQQRRLAGATVDGSMLDAWLRRYNPQ